MQITKNTEVLNQVCSFHIVHVTRCDCKIELPTTGHAIGKKKKYRRYIGPLVCALQVRRKKSVESIFNRLRLGLAHGFYWVLTKVFLGLQVL